MLLPIKIAISGKNVQYSFTLKNGNFFKTKALWYKNLEKNPLNQDPYIQYDLYSLAKYAIYFWKIESKHKKQKLLFENFENLKSWKIRKKNFKFKPVFRKNKFCLKPKKKNLLNLEKDDILSRLCTNNDLKKIIFWKNTKIEKLVWFTILLGIFEIIYLLTIGIEPILLLRRGF